MSDAKSYIGLLTERSTRLVCTTRAYRQILSSHFRAERRCPVPSCPFLRSMTLAAHCGSAARPALSDLGKDASQGCNSESQARA